MLTIKQAAKHLDVHWQTIRNYIDKGYIKPIKMGRTIRIPKDQLSQFRNNKDEKKEVELRYNLKDKTAVEDKVRRLGAKLTNHSHVIDHYYCYNHIKSRQQNNEFYTSPLGHLVRIREIDNDYTGKIITTFEIKKLAGPDFTDHTNCIEAELEIDNRDDADRILSFMNMRNYVTIDKERFVYRYKDIKLCFDTVKDWGDGLEIEKVSTNNNTQQVYKELYAIADKLGLKEEDKPHASFTYEIIKKNARF